MWTHCGFDVDVSCVSSLCVFLAEPKPSVSAVNATSVTVVFIPVVGVRYRVRYTNTHSKVTLLTDEIENGRTVIKGACVQEHWLL